MSVTDDCAGLEVPVRDEPDPYEPDPYGAAAAGWDALGVV